MTIERFDIAGPLLIHPKVFTDDRGCFFESFNLEVFEKLGLPTDFYQDNQSISRKGVIRGLHFQSPPWEQGKLVRVVSGRVIDVAVDIRKESKTYGKHIRIELSGETQALLWIPPGFAHGFSVLEQDTVFLYKCTKPYHPEAEQGLVWNDPDLDINWGMEEPVVSQKDCQLPGFKNFHSPF
ncbi:MAG: hypothetical protein RLZZ630_1050 [Bacteroidota bacterium]|jgi:dTDP-4-dehydrorhamnose 3,5-epimerase